ncbi:MAG: Hsp20/alpha crystallin family protein [Spirochaetes bacterium]|nr:Hsp20/alpha crystallin family protein [Spirochaetota bacterium]
MRKGLSIWQPFSEIERVRREFDRLFDEFFGSPDTTKDYILSPVVDVYETDKDVVIKAEMPGVKKDEIEITVKDNFVHIKAEKKEEKEEKKENIHRVERFYGRVERLIPMPTDVKSEEAKAEYKDGVLEIRIPKEKTSKETKIKIS